MGHVTGDGLYREARQLIEEKLNDGAWHSRDELAFAIVHKLAPEKLVRLAVGYAERSRRSKKDCKHLRSFILDEKKDFRVVLAGSRVLVLGVVQNWLKLKVPKLQRRKRPDGIREYCWIGCSEKDLFSQGGVP